MLIKDADLFGERRDVRLAGDRIEAVLAEISPDPQEQVIDAGGRALLPGLHDHHIHLQATAAALNSVRCGPPHVRNQAELIEVLNTAPGTGWIRAVGYHPSIAGEIDRDWLDANGPARPIRMQHRGGRMWVFNTQAINALDFDCPSDGRLIDSDTKLRAALNSQRPDLGPLVQALIVRGVTGVTDTTPSNDRADFAYLTDNTGGLRTLIMGTADLHGQVAQSRAEVGPLKLHYHDHDLPPLDQLADEIADAHAHNRCAAMHCVTRAEICLALAAFEQAGARHGDRLEHAAIADEDIVDWIARLGITVVTQPHFVADRADAYCAEVEPDELAHLWPLARFQNAGIALAGGSDAPFESFDPWHAMAAASNRPESLSPEEAISPEAALALYTKPFRDAGAPSRKIAPGEAADLCLLDRSWAQARTDLGSVNVLATWTAGERVYDTISSTNPQSNAS